MVAGAATLEVGFLQARSLLTEQPDARILLVYYDEPLPSLYDSQIDTIQVSAALGLLLRLPRPDDAAETALQLSWELSSAKDGREESTIHPVLRLARLLTQMNSAEELDDGRLRWTWNRHAAAA